MSNMDESSGNTTPLSSGQSSNSKRHHSDTTPSPSGYCGPEFNPQTLSSKLALYEASQCLSIVADTLTAAAQAMSKAAASLAVASDHFPNENVYKVSDILKDLGGSGIFSPTSDSSSSDWQQTSYVLSTNVAVPKHEPLIPSSITEINAPAVNADLLNRELSPLDSVGPPATAAPECIQRPAPLVASNIHKPEASPASSNANAQKDNPGTSIPLKSAEITPKEAAQVVNSADKKSKTASKNVTGPKSHVLNLGAEVKPASQIKATTAGPVKNLRSTTAAPVVPLTPKSGPIGVSNPSNSVSKTSIILDRPFDEIPTIAFLSQQHHKTVCIYKYKESAGAFLEMLSILIGSGQVQTAIDSNLKKRAEKLKNFFASKASVLMWSADHKFSEARKSISDSNFQVIHAGEISHANKDISCFKSVVVTTALDVAALNPAQKQDFLKKYPIDNLNGSCNNQDKTSASNGFRVKARAQLAKISVAKPFYTAYISHHYTRDPNWTALRLAKRANEYAKDYLLRSDSGSPGQMVGGRISLTKEEVKKWKLQPAVESGDVIL